MEKITWKAPEHFHKEKTKDWYWIVGIVTISLAILAIIFNNLIFGILIIIASFTLSLFASKKPEIVDIVIDQNGILIGKTLYPFKELESYWVETREAIPRVLVKSKKVLMPFIVILIGDISPDEIKNALKKRLPEEEHSEPLLEKVLLYLGF